MTTPPDDTEDKTLILSDHPDNIDYAKMTAAAKMATEMGCSVVVHALCHECPSVTVVPPVVPKEVRHVTFEHEPWCPIVAYHEGRELTPKQQRQHRRYMDRR